jgi:hypothetical protein
MRDKFLFRGKKEEMIKGKNIALYITWLRVSSMMIDHTWCVLESRFYQSR